MTRAYINIWKSNSIAKLNGTGIVVSGAYHSYEEASR